MPFLIALAFYAHASYCYGALLAHMASNFRSMGALRALGPEGVARLADVLAMAAGAAAYAAAGGFGA